MVASGKLTNFDETFVKQFLVNGSVALPKESMLLPTGHTLTNFCKVIILQIKFRIDQRSVQYPESKQNLLLQHSPWALWLVRHM